MFVDGGSVGGWAGGRAGGLGWGSRVIEVGRWVGR